jgi:hypothetical protein
MNYNERLLNINFDSFLDIVHKMEKYIITMDDVTLYHGTMELDMLDYLNSNEEKVIYFSRTEEQSELHMFNSNCERYNYKEYENKYPVVFRFKNSRPLRLLNIHIEYNDNLNIHLHYMRTLDGKSKEPYIYNNFERSLYNYIKLLDEKTKKCIFTLKDCNKIIMLAIKYFNEHFNMKIDGYYCQNDQDEIPLFINKLSDILDIDNISIKVFDMLSTLKTIPKNKSSQQIDSFRSVLYKLKSKNYELKSKNYELYQAQLWNICGPDTVDYINFMMKNTSPFDNYIYGPYISVPINENIEDIVRAMI